MKKNIVLALLLAIGLGTAIYGFTSNQNYADKCNCSVTKNCSCENTCECSFCGN